MSAAATSLLCFLTHLPGPPQLHFSNFTFQLWSINRRKCPEIDPTQDSFFHLYRQNDPETSKIIIPHDDNSLRDSGIDFSLLTIIFFHGFLESYQSDDAQSIKTAYLEQGDFNVILAQNERLLAGPDYFTAAANCKPIAHYSGLFIDYLVSRGMDLEKLHVIGLSLGGQIAGMTGQFVTSGQLPRITALDPAGPLFNKNPIDERLDPSDARFVDVINTNSGIFGSKNGLGHLNFWPNGGSKQPGCGISDIIERYGLALNWLVFCHHYRSYQLYVESIRSPRKFPSKKCNGYVQFKFGICNNNDVAYMGVYADFRHKGDYYLETGFVGINNG